MEIILLGILPILAFAIADVFLPPRKSILVSLVLAFLLFLYLFMKMKHTDYSLFIDFGFLLALGGLSIKFNDERYFKYQPAIISALAGIFVIYYQVFQNGFIKHFAPMVAETLSDPRQIAQMTDPQNIELLSGAEPGMIIAAVLHCSLMLYLAKKPTWIWTLGKLSGYVLFLVGMMLGIYFNQLK